MKIHEYQAKQILSRYGIPVPKSEVAFSVEEAKKGAEALGEGVRVVKAQIHAGGRGKGGGVKVTTSTEQCHEAIENIFGMQLVTHQTGPEGKEVTTLLIEEGCDIAREIYCGLVIDRAAECPVLMVSSEGGVDIEEVAEKTPEKITKLVIDPALGIRPYQARQVAFSLGLSGDSFKQCVKLVTKLYAFFWAKDCSQVEVNPLVLTPTGDVLALDAKVNFDANALFRHPDVVELRDLSEEDPKEVEASKFDLNYIALDGNVACMVNGAGLAMATMDIIKLAGGEPANFLDVGGAASAETVKNGFKIILSDDNVNAILINIFGGIVRCDRVAKGVVQAVQELNLDVPVVVRLEGTNAIEAKEILENSEVKIIPATTMQDAADKVVNAALN